MSVTTPATDETVAGESLSPEQATALERLLAGSTVTEAARVAGVHRASVHRWLAHDCLFQANWNAGRAEVRDSSEAALLKLAPKALAAIERALDSGDVQVSLSLLKGLGLLSGKPIRIGSGNAADLKAPEFWSGWMPVISGQAVEPPATSRPNRATRRRP